MKKVLSLTLVLLALSALFLAGAVAEEEKTGTHLLDSHE